MQREAGISENAAGIVVGGLVCGAKQLPFSSKRLCFCSENGGDGGRGCVWSRTEHRWGRMVRMILWVPRPGCCSTQKTKASLGLKKPNCHRGSLSLLSTSSSRKPKQPRVRDRVCPSPGPHPKLRNLPIPNFSSQCSTSKSFRRLLFKIGISIQFKC